MKESNLYLGGVLSVIIGLVFLFGAGGCNLPWFIVLLGIASLIKGILIFILGPKKLFPYMEQLLKKPTKALRAFSVIGIVFGVVIIYAS